MNNDIEKKYIKLIKQLNKKYNINSVYGIDNEEYHIEFDELIKSLIKELGYEKISKEYEKAQNIYFWYS